MVWAPSWISLNFAGPYVPTPSDPTRRFLPQRLRASRRLAKKIRGGIDVESSNIVFFTNSLFCFVLE